MYDVFFRLIEERGISVRKMCADLGISPSSITDWKKGRSVPKLDKMQRIADYFGVSLHYLMTGEAEADLDEDPVLSGLVADFQTLNDEQKKRALAYIRGLRDAYDAFLASADR